jgi:hypothetical protein
MYRYLQLAANISSDGCRQSASWSYLPADNNGNSLSCTFNDLSWNGSVEKDQWLFSTFGGTQFSIKFNESGMSELVKST